MELYEGLLGEILGLNRIADALQGQGISIDRAKRGIIDFTKCILAPVENPFDPFLVPYTITFRLLLSLHTRHPAHSCFDRTGRLRPVGTRFINAAPQ
jgi:hypothetical protein